MSAPYKVMEQMQKTRPRRLRGNREVMIVLGCIVVVGTLLLVRSLNKRLNADNRTLQRPIPTQVQVGATHNDDDLVIQVSLNEANHWVVDGHGEVTQDGLMGIFKTKRAEADEQSRRAVVRAQISGKQPARHFLELHKLAEECGLDQVNVQTNEALLEDDDS